LPEEPDDKLDDGPDDVDRAAMVDSLSQPPLAAATRRETAAAPLRPITLTGASSSLELVLSPDDSLPLALALALHARLGGGAMRRPARRGAPRYSTPRHASAESGAPRAAALARPRRGLAAPASAATRRAAGRHAGR
jgi:hypothetical protein